MAVSKETVLHTLGLARLEAPADDNGLEDLAGQLAAIVDYMDILNQAEVEGVEPLFSPVSRVAPPREDEAGREYSRDEVLANAPEREEFFFVVPRVL
jgi:aspartyl-tRNA(Asn)/glutamyl-tRNA(Gln) amidotransferase subunit C